MSWTDERVEQLKALWAQGVSASQIAKQIGGVSRNAVIGKVHRLGLSNRAPEKDEATPEEAAPPPAPEPEEPPPPPPEPEEPETPEIIQESPDEPPRVDLALLEKKARRLSLLDLTERTCKWPIGDPNHADFHFCGLTSAPGKPYCPSHALAAYQPMSTRRERERERERNRPPRLIGSI